MKMLLNDFKNEIINKYNYDENFAETIALAAESIIDYLGKEYASLVYNAVSSCKYSIQQTPIRKVGEYSKTNGEYTSVPEIEKTNGEYRIKAINKNITLPNTFNQNSPASIGLLVNRTMSLVRSHANEFNISDNMLVQRQGFKSTSYKLKTTNGEVTLSKPNVIGEGLEEGITSYSELAIMRNDYDSNYDLSIGNDYERITAGYLMDNLGLKESLTSAAMTGNKDALNTVMEETTGLNFDEFLANMDGIHKLEAERRNNITDAEKLKSSLPKLDQYFETQIVPYIHKMNASLNPEISEEYISRKI